MADAPQQRAFILSSPAAFREPPAEALQVCYQETWSNARTSFLGRRVWAYMVWHPESADGPVNATLHYYDVEVFVGVHGEVCATCSCPATVICKHIVEALIYIAWHEPLPSTPPASWMWSFLNYYSDLCRIIEESGAGDIEL